MVAWLRQRMDNTCYIVPEVSSREGILGGRGLARRSAKWGKDYREITVGSKALPMELAVTPLPLGRRGMRIAGTMPTTSQHAAKKHWRWRRVN
mmetsp:Transcript_92167/g.127955  ORF Transcript_92167/g.127955 Transcript_92167/m.127955 type:complete len:93 (-) Transcript_92167:8-286(-)